MPRGASAHPERLEEGFVRELSSLTDGRERLHLLVAASGGLDSTVLLHLLRFSAPEHIVSVAHLDHAMRRESGGDLLWLRGLCTAWRVELHTARLPDPPRSEGAARDARYEFLHRTARDVGADWILTAHHADDQAETVLFRILRGTGLRGLAGIPPRTGDGVLRPLLAFWRRDLAGYAAARGLRWRRDASNRSLLPSRNRLRLRLLPEIERAVAPGARRNLVALAAGAREAEEALEALAERAERETVTRDGAAFLLARARFAAYDAAIATRLLRRLLRQLGCVPAAAGTRSAVQFITDASSGREMELPGGVRIRLEFELARLERPGAPEADVPLALLEPPRGHAVELQGRIGGRRCRLLASREAAPAEPAGEESWSIALPLTRARFPLTLRAWQNGDRMRTPGGTKSLKKLFLERRIPRSQRHTLPVLVDGGGAVLWVPRLGAAPVEAVEPGAEILFLTVVHG